jgi:hypothetical protein
MFTKTAKCLFFITMAIVMSGIFKSTARAANCGGSVPCACGDNVVASRKLVLGVDPVVANACAGDGLIMSVPGITLDLNANKIQGLGTGIGILINDVDGVTIKNGKVDNFGTGIGTAGTTSSSVIDAVKPMKSADDGIFLQGDGNELTGILAKSNGNNGVTVIGNNNLLEDHNDEYNKADGIFVQGDGNELIANRASENVGNGITLQGNNNTLELNNMNKLNTNGIVVMGNNNTLSTNKASKHKGDGITVVGDFNILTNNKAIANQGVGIAVVGIGDPAASTGNVVSLNGENPQCSIYGVTVEPTCKQT